MITDVLFTVFFNILNFLTDLIPSIASQSSLLSGLPGVGTFIGQIVGVLKAFVPFGDFFAMLAIMFSISGIRLVFQVINLIWP